METRIKALDALPLEQSLSVAIGEGDDHALKVYRGALLTPNVKLDSHCNPPATQLNIGRFTPLPHSLL